MPKKMRSYNSESSDTDVVMIGAGIMSATLAVLLKHLEPDLKIDIYERLDSVAGESSGAWNNAGTGHSAFCELNYTPELPDGSVNTEKAVKVAESFEISMQFWSYLAKKNILDAPERFIKKLPHISFVKGKGNVDFLKKRYKAMQSLPLFREMEYSENQDELADWMPLVMNGRDSSEKVAATKMDIGTDVNFGAITDQLFDSLKGMPGVNLHLNHEVRNLKQKKNKQWRLKLKDLETGEKRKVKAGFVFIGAGGGALPLLLKSGIPEGKGFGGFPVSGKWLTCSNPEVVEKHQSKVYGKAEVGAPPMSVPHLDTRVINGERELLFGPFAGFTTKFLKEGSYLDLPLSIKSANLYPLISAGVDNLPLTRYLINQVQLTPEERVEELQKYYPEAKLEDWELKDAGKRVQIIKKDPQHGGILQFGTEIVASEDGSIAALLGASPGASTAVKIMLDLFKKCFKEQYQTSRWQNRIREMIPSFGQKLNDNPDLLEKLRRENQKVLGLSTQKDVAHVNA